MPRIRDGSVAVLAPEITSLGEQERYFAFLGFSFIFFPESILQKDL